MQTLWCEAFFLFLNRVWSPNCRSKHFEKRRYFFSFSQCVTNRAKSINPCSVTQRTVNLFLSKLYVLYLPQNAHLEIFSRVMWLLYLVFSLYYLYQNRINKLKPLWTYPGRKSGISVRELISTLKKKEVQAGNEWSSLLHKIFESGEKLPLYE